MCICAPTKRGIDKLPKVGTYYKRLVGNHSSYRDFLYPKGIEIIIPEREQYISRIHKFGECKRTICAGGHFYKRKKDAEWYRRKSEKIAKFIIKRQDITHIGCAKSHREHIIILASRAKRIS